MLLSLVIATLCFSSFSILAQGQMEVIEVQAKPNHLLGNKYLTKRIDSEVIADAAISSPTMADFLSQHPSISLNGQGGLFQSYSIRGFSRARIRTEVDGVPIITDRRAGNSLSFVNSAFIERADIQTGPASTLYGSDALGGVVNLVSRHFDHRQVTYSRQHNDQRQNLALLWGTQNWQSGVAVQRANNSESANGVPLHTAFEQFSGLVKFRQSHDDYLVQTSWLPSVGRNIGKSSIYYPHDRVTNYPEDNHSLFQVSVTHHDDWFVKFFHHYQHWNVSTLRVNQRRNQTNYQGHTLGGGALLKDPFGIKNSRMGLDWTSRQSIKIHEEEYALSGTLNYSNALVDGQQNNFAMFADRYWHLDSWQFSAGGRLDYIEQVQSINNQRKSDTQLSMNVIASLPVNDNLLQVELASGFRFPSLSELFYAGETPRGTTTGNPDLLPEHSIGGQISTRLALSYNMTADIAAYYYRLSNYIERYYLDDDHRSYQNLNNANLFGFEFSIDWQLSNQVNTSLHGHYQQGEGENGKALADATPSSLVWHTIWHWQNLQISNSLTWLLPQNEVADGELRRESAMLWQVSVEKQFSPQLTISVYGRNLLDEDLPATLDDASAKLEGQAIGIKFVYQFND